LGTADDRFAVLGLAITAKMEIYNEILRKYINEKSITFQHGLLGHSGYNTFNELGGSSWPHNVLIGPDGKIIVTGIKGEDLQQKVAEAIENYKN